MGALQKLLVMVMVAPASRHAASLGCCLVMVLAVGQLVVDRGSVAWLL
jgi:hypothetical protein